MVHHVLFFPIPAQGHLPPMLTLAEHLTADTDISVTFLNTTHIHNKLKTSSPSIITRLAQIPNFQFLTISDGLPNEDPRSPIQFLDIEESMRMRASERYREILVGEKVNCVVVDGLWKVAFEVPEKVGIPVMLMHTCSAASVLALSSFERMLEAGELPFPEAGDQDQLVQGVPGMKHFLRRRDLPSPAGHAKSADDIILQYLVSVSKNLSKAKAVIFNTTESLDSKIMMHIRMLCPIVYPIGPLKKMSDYVSMWKVDRSCLSWLDSQPDKSVVYVSFGSITIISKETFLEFWHGLVNSGKRFLWVVRHDKVEGGDLVLPKCDMGRIVMWAPQEEVLAHKAVGCFLTHSGWNSTLESIVAGVPMICWPFYGDQLTNSRFVSEVWKIGVDMKDLNKREVVEKMVRKVMEEKEGEEIRKNVGEMSLAVRMATKEGGTSFASFQLLVEHIKSF